VLFAALDVNDSLWVWGTSFHGAFGIGHGAANGSVVLPPTKIKQFSGQIKDYQISCSDTTSSVITIITKNNKMYAAGTNTYGQLARNYFSVQSTHTHREFKFEECLKRVSGTTSQVADASFLADILYAGTTNNFYIDTSGQVWACGSNAEALLGDGTISSANQTTFTKIDDLSNVKKLIINGKNKPIAFALTNDGKIYSWGYNGAAKGQTLTNEIILSNIRKPARCWNYDKKTEVDNAVDIFCSDNIVADQALMAYIDSNKYVYFGGYKADVLGPTFPDNIPFFKRFNVKNVTNDILISGDEALVHRENGTVFQVRSIGPQKLF
jgi:alpha-tubulin suppressor-like RCC1 family protein